MPKVLIITSNHGELAGKPNGTYLPELTHAVEVLTAEGIEYDLASPKGGKIPGYGEDADDVTKKLLADPEFAARLESTKCLDDVDGSLYDAIFYPGGECIRLLFFGNEKSLFAFFSCLGEVTILAS